MPFCSTGPVNSAYGIAQLVVAIEAWEAARNRRTAAHPTYQATPGLLVVFSRVAADNFEPGTGNGVPSRARLED